MSTSGYHSEWITIGRHRILIECRSSFPDETMRLIAQVAAVTCDSHSEGDARVVALFLDNKSSTVRVEIATTNPEDRKLDGILMKVLHNMYNRGDFWAEITVVEPGNTDSDHYNHAEHLSVQAGVAADRFRHQDVAYMRTVSPPS